MVRILMGVFIVLHGFVHLLYYGQSARHFELQPGMVWPDGAWALSRLVGDASVRKVTSALLILVAVGFAAGGVGLLVKGTWWRAPVLGAAVLSSVLYLLCWDGVWVQLANKGLIAVLINLAILFATVVFLGPILGF